MFMTKFSDIEFLESQCQTLIVTNDVGSDGVKYDKVQEYIKTLGRLKALAERFECVYELARGIPSY